MEGSRDEELMKRAKVLRTSMKCDSFQSGVIVIPEEETQAKGGGEEVLPIDADNFNSFIENSDLIDFPLGGRLFTWMNKTGTKLNKLDRFLISKEAAEALPDVYVTAIDRLWSDHNHILLYVSKFDFGPMPFKLFHSWLLHDSFDEVIKTELPKLEEHNF
ncbi:RNA-directed DNA polymerase, eukaryota, reverse transcriptase zinc-binding domain protein [Tanacetum coccineum]